MSLEVAGRIELDVAFCRDLQAFPGGQIASGVSSLFHEGEMLSPGNLKP